MVSLAMRIALMSLLVVLLVACASSTRWYLNGHSQYQFNIDDAQCQAYASSTYQAQGASYMGQGAGSGDGTMAMLGALLTTVEYGDVSAKYQNCMYQRGYTVAN